jgi:beta-glucanase (GH16 family)
MLSLMKIVQSILGTSVLLCALACSSDEGSTNGATGGSGGSAGAGAGGTASGGAAGAGAASGGAAGAGPGGTGGMAGSGGVAGASAATPQIGDTDSKGRVLWWSDEFDGPDIDRTKWGNETGLVRNMEEQYYTTSSDNQFIENRELVIRAKLETMGGGKYTSASLTTEGKTEFLYGRIEARMRVPSATGAWPAFWLLPANKAKYDKLPPYNSWWPAGGEIDVMEFVSQTPNTIYGTVHFLKGDTNDNEGDTFELTAAAHEEYHVFSIDWSPTEIVWQVDGTQFHSFDISQPIDERRPFNDPMYIIVNLAVGGTWPEDPESTDYPSDFRIDWIRAWK